MAEVIFKLKGDYAGVPKRLSIEHTKHGWLLHLVFKDGTTKDEFVTNAQLVYKNGNTYNGSLDL